MVIEGAARRWRKGRMGYRKRTSLWEMRERVVTTKRDV